MIGLLLSLFRCRDSRRSSWDYLPVPLETAFKVRVRYRFAGELKPLPYRLDEQEAR